MIVKGSSIRRVADGGTIVPLHEATFVDEDSVGVSLISDQYGLESILDKQQNNKFLVNLSTLFIYPIVEGMFIVDMVVS